MTAAFFKRFGAQSGGDVDVAVAPDGTQTATDEAGVQNTASNEATDGESGGDAKKGKKSWTAWISKF